VVALNRVGQSLESPFSATEFAASKPGRPEPPQYISSTSTSITLEFAKVEDNGGTEISSYRMWVVAESDDSHTEVTSYDQQSLRWTIDSADLPGFTTGQVYKLKISALNVIGEGELSNATPMAMSMRANPPTTPTVDRSLSSFTSLFIRWTEGAQGDIPILGYYLYLIDLATGQVSLVYDGGSNPNIFTYHIQHLETAHDYSVYAVSRDFNGLSLESSEAVFTVCLQPAHIDRPYFVEATKSTITLAWEKPKETGGCPILSYHLLIKAPTDSEFAVVDDSQIANKPYLTQHTVEGLSSVSEIYSFQIQVVNSIGSFTSMAVDVMLAAVPD
jgi:hypothetical protein